MNFWKKWIKPKEPASKPKAALAERAKPRPATPIRGHRPPVTHDPHRDLAPPKHSQMRKICQYLYRANPIAKRGIKNLCSFVTSEGFAPRATCEDDDHRAYMQAWLDEWWDKNGWDRLLPKRYETLSVEGEWFFWRGAPNARGISRMCYLRPERIAEVEVDELDAERFHRVKLSPSLEFEVDGEREFRSELTVADEECPCGEVLYLQLNALVGQTRGFSDLLVVADWLDQLDTVILTEVERVQYQRAFSWFVKLTGVEPGKLLEAQGRIQAEGPPGPGGVLVHNETEEWEAKSPQLHLEDSVQFIKFVMHLCFGGLYMPEHYYATGGDVNKATSSNMDTPIFAVARDRKKDLKEFLRLAITLDLQQAREMGVFAAAGMTDDDCFHFEIHSKDPDRSAYDLLGEMLNTFGTAMQLGQAEGWITPVEAAQAFRMAANGMGLGDFPGVDLESLQKAAQAKLEAQKAGLSQQFPLRVGAPGQGLTEAEDGEDKKKAEAHRDLLAKELNSRWKPMAKQARMGGREAEAMVAEAVDILRRLGPTVNLDVSAVASLRDNLFRAARPSIDLQPAVNSGRRLMDLALQPYGLTKPAESSFMDRVVRDVVARHEKDGRLEKAFAWIYADKIANEIDARATKAKEQGWTMAQFAGSLMDDPSLKGSLLGKVGGHAQRWVETIQLEAMREAEMETMREYATANPAWHIRKLFVRVKGGGEDCSCGAYANATYDLGDGPRLPVHPYCGCIYLPVVDGVETLPSQQVGKLAGAVAEEMAVRRVRRATLPEPEGIIFSRQEGYLPGYEDLPTVVAYPLEDTGYDMRAELARVRDLPLVRPKGLKEDLSRHSSDPGQESDYIQHFFKAEWRERLRLYAPAMATLEDPDYLAKAPESGKMSYYRRVQLGPNEPPIIMKVILAQNPSGKWFPLTWFDASTDPLKVLNSKLKKDKGRWLL